MTYRPNGAACYEIPPSPIWNIHSPTVFRMMELCWVEEFFKNGNLLISSFARFRSYKDEHRGDKQEGSKVVEGIAPNGHTALMFLASGQNAFVLCGTSARPTRQMLRRFNANAAIQIFDPTEFGKAIAGEIPGFLAGLEGHCNYHNARIQAAIEDCDLQSIKEATSLRPILRRLAERSAKTAIFFNKHKKFASQVEYRWLWFTSSLINEPIVVHVPEARKYCRIWVPERFSLKSWLRSKAYHIYVKLYSRLFPKKNSLYQK